MSLDLDAPHEMLTKMCILCRLKILRPSPKNGSKDVASQDADTHFFLYFHLGHRDFATSQHLDIIKTYSLFHKTLPKSSLQMYNKRNQVTPFTPLSPLTPPLPH